MQFKRAETVEEVKAFLAANPALALDTETTGLNPRKDRLLDFVLANDREAILCDVRLATGLIGAINTFIMHNSKFDLAVLSHNGIDLSQNQIWDTLLMDHLRNESDPHGLDHIIQTRWQDPYKEQFWAKYDNYEQAAAQDQLEYACKDAIYTYRLWEALKIELAADDVPSNLITHVHEFSKALLDTELKGIAVDLDYLETQRAALAEQMVTLHAKMREMAGGYVEALELEYWAEQINLRSSPKGKANVPKPVFNFSSTKQLSDLLYTKLKLPAQINKAKKLTVDDAALEKLAYKHPLPAIVRDYRNVSKVQGSFIDGTLKLQEGGRIYPLFKVTGTVTGRISSESPNMQQLPREGGVRGIYVADQGRSIITADYGSLEVVVAAHFSQDKNLLKIVLEGASKHDITAAALGIERHQAKVLNFAMQYQCSPSKVSEILGVSHKEAQHVHNKYWETYSGERAVIETCKDRIRSGLPIVTPWGRKRRFPRTFEQKWHMEAAFRQGYSALIQGTGADITNYAYYKYAQAVKSIGRALFPVHDEIVAEIDDAHVEAGQALLKSVMEEAPKRIALSVPLKAELGKAAKRWEKS